MCYDFSWPYVVKGDYKNMNNPYLPRKVQELADDIQSNTDVPPTIDRITPHRYRITIANQRVHCTVDYKFTGNRWEWADSKLVVDNKRRPIMESPAAFYRLFKDPDSDGLPTAQPIPPLSPSLQQLDPRMEEALLARLKAIDENAIVRILSAPSREILEFVTARSVVRWAIVKGGLQLQLFVMDGLDYTARFNQDHKQSKSSSQAIMADVLAFLGISHGVEIEPMPQKNTYPTQRSTATPGISDSVRVRQQSVMRI